MERRRTAAPLWDKVRSGDDGSDEQDADKAQSASSRRQGDVQDESWRALRNLRVRQQEEGDDEEEEKGAAADNQQGHHRHGGHLHSLLIPDDEEEGAPSADRDQQETAQDRVSKSSLSFILDDRDSNNSDFSNNYQSSAPSSVVSGKPRISIVCFSVVL